MPLRVSMYLAQTFVECAYRTSTPESVKRAISSINFDPLNGISTQGGSITVLAAKKDSTGKRIPFG
jgi:hypothetical protein